MSRFERELARKSLEALVIFELVVAVAGLLVISVLVIVGAL